MKIDDLAFSSRRLLGLIDGAGLAGCWSWSFAEDRHVWSPGLFQLLGLDAATVAPRYDLLFGLVHPADRGKLGWPADLRDGTVESRTTLRIPRADGSESVLSSHVELFCHPGGRPHGVAGVMIDVTDRQRLAEARRFERGWREALFAESRTVLYRHSTEGVFSFPQQASELTGVSPAELAEDPFLTIAAEEREAGRARSQDAVGAGIVHSSTPLLRIDRQARERFVTFSVPVRSACGQIVNWSSIARPIGAARLPACDGVDGFREDFDRALAGHHIRAARGLLDWSMEDLARASSVSLSTIRRAEEQSGGHSARCWSRIIAALRTGGVRFLLVGNDTIAVAKA